MPLLRFYKLLLIPILLTFSALTPQQVLAQNKDMAEDIVNLTNKFRAKKGLPPVQLDSDVSKQAQKHSRDMASGKVPFGHEGFEDRAAILAKQKGKVSAAAENVAVGQQGAEDVVNTWIKSPPHRKNMLGDYRLIGIGIAEDRKGKLYFTQYYIR